MCHDQPLTGGLNLKVLYKEHILHTCKLKKKCAHLTHWEPAKSTSHLYDVIYLKISWKIALSTLLLWTQASMYAFEFYDNIFDLSIIIGLHTNEIFLSGTLNYTQPIK